MFNSVLVANRGEIAVRVIATLRRMGIRAVVAASIPDRQGLAVRRADASVLLEGYSAAESYLNMEAVIAAAKGAGCEAIHPGYGFLSERAEFAERCAAEGIAFIGPPAAVLRGVGDKAAARQLALANGIPVVPGWDGADDDETLVREGAGIGFPVMVKARGGGGGRGMRAVHDAGALPEALESARREALSAFGDGGLLLEKLLLNAHHVEVQVIADAHGALLHLGERDCSVQRRHQKLVEESPSPVVNASLRADLTAAALKLARVSGYVNAGTFEFLVGEAEAPGSTRPYYFLEVNPRLQVEHPVTELVTGLDLVELQLRVAAGEHLPLRQEGVRFAGHGIDFRINAEDPWDAFRPSSGRLRALSLGHADARVDAGYEAGDSIPPNYDSLMAKVVVHGDTRGAALAAAARALGATRVEGVRTNTRLHARLVQADVFREGAASVQWLEDNLEALLEEAATPPGAWAATAAALLGPAPWVSGAASVCWLDDGIRTRMVTFTPGHAGTGTAALDDGNGPGHGIDVRGHGAETTADEVDVDGAPAIVRRTAAGLRCETAGRSFMFTVAAPPPLPRRAHAAAPGATTIAAPLAGTIASVAVSEGDQVAEGQLLVVLEAMKMEHRITAPAAGVVKTLAVAARDVVREGDVLAEMG
ncbi:MAG: acetyl/propionyl/methylcrotonyl-CoA carboxylase subunit alpha [Tepidiformaceae bacterium]